jgi:hypothetical protein
MFRHGAASHWRNYLSHLPPITPEDARVAIAQCTIDTMGAILVISVTREERESNRVSLS